MNKPPGRTRRPFQSFRYYREQKIIINILMFVRNSNILPTQNLTIIIMRRLSSQV